MLRSNFNDVRKTPVDRAGVFVPEILLVRSLKAEEEKTKVNIRLTEDIFRDAANKILPDIDAPTQNRIISSIRNIRHLDDLDPKVLVVAAYLKLLYPYGFNLQMAAQEGTLSNSIMNGPGLNGLVAEITASDETKGPEVADGLKADILAYYLLLAQ